MVDQPNQHWDAFPFLIINLLLRSPIPQLASASSAAAAAANRATDPIPADAGLPPSRPQQKYRVAKNDIGLAYICPLSFFAIVCAGRKKDIRIKEQKANGEGSTQTRCPSLSSNPDCTLARPFFPASTNHVLKKHSNSQSPAPLLIAQDVE